MKAFVVAALLVVAQAQNLETMKELKETGYGLFKPHHRFNLKPVEDLLMKEKLNNMRVTPDIDRMDLVDTLDIIKERDTIILPLEVMLREPLFLEYLRIPLFRQFWEEHPTVFRRYVESPLFQKFWTVPEFKQYFRNPVLFYKYILPQVKVITDLITPTTMTDKLWDVDSTYTTPFTTPSTWNLPYYKRDVTTWDVKPTVTLPELKYLLVKIMNHLKINKMDRDIFTPTTDMWDRPISMNVDDEIVRKVIDPITLKEKYTPVGDFKIPMEVPFGFENKNLDDIMFDKREKVETLKEILLKKLILTKLFGKTVTPKLYETLVEETRDPIYNPYRLPEKKVNLDILTNIFGNKKFVTPEVYETVFDTNKVMTPELFEGLFGINKKEELLPEIYDRLVLKNKINNKFINPEILETVFGKKIYKPEVYETLFGEVPKVDTFNFDLTMNKPLINNPLITRMLKNKKIFTPKIKLEKEKMLVEEMEKELLLKKKEELKFPKVFTTETEIPKMMETEKFMKPLVKIPLTFNKPIGVEDFEIKV